MVFHKQLLASLHNDNEVHSQPPTQADAQTDGGVASQHPIAGSDIGQLVEAWRKHAERKIRDNRVAENKLYGTPGALPATEQSVLHDAHRGTPLGLWRYPVPDTLAKPAAIAGKQTSFSIVDMHGVPGSQRTRHETHLSFLSRSTAFPDTQDLDDVAKTATKNERLEDDRRLAEEVALEEHMPVGSEELTRHLLKMPKGGPVEGSKAHSPDKSIDDLIDTALTPQPRSPHAEL
mmetsp:Transcript_31426/g.57761  ORF Transcript_31426/g.57761 Transcript_31426/m.57761 type:complete len:233 (-) Transcript_31426:48-746(-)